MTRARVFATVLWALVAAGSLISTATKARADSVDLPLHLEPIRLRPFYDYVDDAAVTAVDGGYYGAYGGYGIALQSTGAAAYPNPLPVSPSYQTETGAAQVSGEALVAWGGGHVYAALQAHADWTHLSRPLVDLGPGRCPEIASAGDAGLVVWFSTDVMVARLEAASWPSHEPPIPISGMLPSMVAAAFAPGADVYLAVWDWVYGNGIYGRVLNSLGLPITETFSIAAVEPLSLSASWDGSSFVVVWSTSSSVDAIRVSTLGMTVGQPIHVAGPDPAARFAKGASRSGESLVSWIEGGEYPEPTYRVRGARISPSGVVLDPGGFLIHEGTRENAYASNKVGGIASDGDEYLVTWIENYGSCGGLIVDLQDVLAAAVYPGSPPVAGPVQLVSGSAQQIGLGAAWVGDTIWTAWLGHNRIGDEMLAARRDADGTLLDPAGIALGSVSSCGASGQTNTFYVPVVAGSPNVVLTIWHHFQSIQDYGDFCYGPFLLHNEAGELVGGNGFAPNGVSSFCGGPLVAASDGSQFFLALIGPDPDDQPVLRWAGLTESGQSTSGGYLDVGAEEAPLDAASNGNGFLLAWSVAGDGRDAYVGRFTSDLTILDPAGIPLATGPGNQALVRTASDGAGYLAVWVDAGTLRAARIDPGTGVVLDPGGFVVVNRAVAPFDLDWDGRHYVVAWAEQDGTQDVVQIRRIGSDGSSPDPAPVEVLRRSDELLTCSVASRDDGLSFIALTTRRPAYGSMSGHGILYTNPATTAVAMPTSPAVAAGVLALPNPFRAEAVLQLGDRAGRPGTLRILDAVGRTVRVFEAPDGLAPRVRWDGKDGRGQQLSPGIYFYEVVAADGAPATGKLTKLR